MYILLIQEWIYTRDNKKDEHLSEGKKEKAPIDGLKATRLPGTHMGSILYRRRPDVEVLP
jgi:hypothetical protein